MTWRDVMAGRARWAIEHAENLTFLRALPPGCAHLVYLDPPFFTMRDFFLADGETLAFSDRWPSLDVYLDALVTRCVAAWPLLTAEGCLVVHVDPAVSHYLKVALDGAFGRARFASEIIWRYRRMPDGGRNFQGVHDVLLRYVRDPARARWTQLFEPLAPSTLAIHGTKKQRGAWVDGKKKALAHAAEDSPGVPLGDVWEIGILAANGSERTGYPTQKPEALLERLILACTARDDLVVDPTCGSGTTIAVAERHGRRAIGCDQGVPAVRIARARLEQQTAQGRLFIAEGA